MKTGNLAIFLVCLLGLSFCDVHDPAALVRSVTMENTFIKILNYVKNGHH